ncbi:MAG: ParB N-terminal domain-containing protein [Candidatus Micrarchaeota archaeon]
MKGRIKAETNGKRKHRLRDGKRIHRLQNSKQKQKLRNGKRKYTLMSIRRLKSHEQIQPDRLAKLILRIQKDGMLKKPILVDGKNHVILDGHHRAESLKRLKLKKIPAILVDYSSRAIKLASRREKIHVSKHSVIRHALQNQPFPPKTSRHTFKHELTDANVQLDLLK